ncbi:MAG TPA: OsmC family protein [Vicinamibacterales bacterium]
MAVETRTTMNGLDVNQLFGTLEAIKGDPGLARFQFRARNRWIDGGLNRSTIRDFYGGGQEDTSRTEPFVFANDEPPVLLGENRGANPVEFVLHALAGCLTTSLVLHAAARGIRVNSVETRFEGDLDVRGLLGIDDSVRNGYERIKVTFKVSADAPDSVIDELITLAQKRSPVFDVVSHGVPVEVRRER